MKTTAQKIVGIATIALFSLSLNAQNTKSVHFVNYSPEASGYVSKKMERISLKLSDQIQKLARFVKFVPRDINEDAYAEVNYDFSDISEQLSKEVKYVPSTDLEINYEETNFDSILEELKPNVKYTPSQEVSDDSVFDRLTAELEKTVRFYPANI